MDPQPEIRTVTVAALSARVAGTVAVALALVLTTAMPASAHDRLVSSDPLPGATVTTPLERIELTFSDALLNLGGIDSAFVIQVSDGAGRFYGSGCVDLSNETVSTGLTLNGPGRYTVRWQVTSADGHPISDSYTFEYSPPAGAEAVTGSDTAPTCRGKAAPAPAATGSEATSSAASADAGLVTGLIVGVSALLVVGGALLFMMRRRTPRRRDRVDLG